MCHVTVIFILQIKITATWGKHLLQPIFSAVANYHIWILSVIMMCWQKEKSKCFDHVQYYLHCCLQYFLRILNLYKRCLVAVFKSKFFYFFLVTISPSHGKLITSLFHSYQLTRYICTDQTFQNEVWIISNMWNNKWKKQGFPFQMKQEVNGLLLAETN